MACPVSVLGCWFEPTRGAGGGGGVIQLVSPAIASQISLNNVHKGGLKQRNFQCPHLIGQFGIVTDVPMTVAVPTFRLLFGIIKLIVHVPSA